MISILYVLGNETGIILSVLSIAIGILSLVQANRQKQSNQEVHAYYILAWVAGVWLIIFTCIHFSMLDFCKVPNVVNQTKQEAIAILNSEELTPEFSDGTSEDGIILSQNPEAYEVVRRGTVVYINQMEIADTEETPFLAGQENFAEEKDIIPTELIVEREPIEIIAIEAGNYHSVYLRSDGTVTAVGNNLLCDVDNVGGRCDVGNWKDIVAISATNHTVGLKSDGTVVAVGYNNCKQCNISHWTDIVSISTGLYHTVGLKADGTVVAAGLNTSEQCDVSGWTDIVAIAAGAKTTYGLKSDGTVVATGANGSGQKNVGSWSDIIAISAGISHVVGLKSDGTVVAAGISKEGKRQLADWEDIISISTGDIHTVGLRSDGKVFTIGSNNNNQCDVGDWEKIIAISAGVFHTLGLRADGTVVAVGNNGSGQLDVP